MFKTFSEQNNFTYPVAETILAGVSEVIVYQPTTMQKQPASLVRQAMNVYEKKETFSCFDMKKWIDRIFKCDGDAIRSELFQVADPFSFEIVDDISKIFDDDLNCDEETNTLHALVSSEFEPIYFKLLEKFIFKYGFFGYRIPVSLHFYHYMYDNGLMDLFYNLQLKSDADIQFALLQLAGDVESNPGPTYKEINTIKYSKRINSNNINADKKNKFRFKKQFCKEREQVKIDMEEVLQGKMQIAELLVPAASLGLTSYLGYKTNNTLNKATSSVDILTSEISQTLKHFRDFFSKAEQFIFKGLNVLDLLSDIVLGLIQVSLAAGGKKLASLGIEVFRILVKYGIPTTLVDEIRTITNLSFDKIKAKMQINVKETVELLTPTHICLFIYSILSVVFTQALPKVTTIETMITRIGNLSRAGKNISDFNTATHGGLNLVLNEVKKTLGLRPQEEVETLISGIDKWFDEVRILLARKDDIKNSDELYKDTNMILHIEDLYKRGLEFSREITDKKVQKEMVLPFQMHMRYLTELVKQVDTSGAFGTRPRTQPVVIWLFGESGVGKSGMSWPLAVDLNNIFVPNAIEAKEFSKNIYMRNVEQEFWDNYQGQNVVIYDDFGQRVDSTAKPNEEFMELIRTANIAPYPLHMAHLEDKRKTRFTSKILLLTSNVFEQNVNSLTFPDAFRRRIDLCARIKNLDEFTKDGFSTKDSRTVKRLDKKKVLETTGSIISTKVYSIDLIDPESGLTYDSDLTYEEFLDKAKELTIDAFDSSKKMNEFLENYAEERFKGMMQGHYSDPTPDIPPEFEPIEDLEWDHFLPLVHNNQIRYKIGKQFTDNDLALIEEAYFESDSDEEYDVWRIDYIKKYLCVKSNRIIGILKKCKNKFLTKAKEYLSTIKDFVINHPFTVFSSVFAVILGILAATRFWNNINDKIVKTQQVSEFKRGNLIFKKYNGENAIDLRGNNSSVLKKVIPQVISRMAAEASISFILDRQYSFLYSLISNTNRSVTFYLMEKLISFAGKQMELSDEMIIPKAEAHSSGDVNTLSKIKNVVEAAVSGDLNTIHKNKNVLEAVSSADPNTLIKHKTLVEATSSGDPNTIIRSKRVMEGENAFIPANMQMWKDQVAQNLITNRIFSNLYKICKVLDDSNVTPLLNGLFVKGNVMLVPQHLCEYLNNTDTIEIRNSFDIVFTIPWRDIKQIPLTNSIGECKEACLLVFPNQVHQHADIVKHFSNAESLNRFKRSTVCLPVIRYSSKIKKLLMTILGNTESIAKDKPIIIDDMEAGKEYTIRESYTYNLPTTNGDCGAPLIINETQVLRKIAGIHVAGCEDGRAFSESITQKDLERGLERVPAKMQVSVDFDNQIDKHIIDLELNKEINVGEFSDKLVPSMCFNPLGKIRQPLFEPGKTELRKSLIYGQITDIKTKPAKLRNYIENGELINIKHKNLAKCALNTPYLDQALLDECAEMVKNKWIKNRRKELARILKYEEAIIGSPDSVYLGPINRQSSPGYPWILERPSGCKGKTGWFGDDDYVLSEEVKLAVENRIKLAAKGIRAPTMWVDTLKDERRPISKVDAGKTRVFSNGPMDFSIAFRQYFLGFVAHLMENRIENEVSIGTNVYSRDWTQTASKLLSKGKKVIAGDFSTFDGTLNSSMMFQFLKVVNAFYDDGEENALIRYVLFSEVVNSIHLCNDMVYMMTHSQPSGNPVTTPLNCFINSCGIRMVFKYCLDNVKKNNPTFPVHLKDFDTHVSIVSYGDDNIINFTDKVAPFFNMDTITEGFNKLGMIYTDESKVIGKIVPQYKTLEEVSYLKRSFVHSNGRWLAPLELDTILEMPNWCRGGLDIVEGTKVNCENAIMELAMHPEPIYDQWKEVISKAYYRNTNDTLDVDSYRGYNQYWLEQYFF